MGVNVALFASTIVLFTLDTDLMRSSVIYRVIEDNQYLSDVAVHLFLQSSLPIKEIERYLDGMVSDGEILNSFQSPGKGKHSGLSRSMAEIPHEIETHLEHDSGFCYSTTSSINDLSKFCFVIQHFILNADFM